MLITEVNHVACLEYLVDITAPQQISIIEHFDLALIISYTSRDMLSDMCDIADVPDKIHYQGIWLSNFSCVASKIPVSYSWSTADSGLAY